MLKFSATLLVGAITVCLVTVFYIDRKFEQLAGKMDQRLKTYAQASSKQPVPDISLGHEELLGRMNHLQASSQGVQAKLGEFEQRLLDIEAAGRETVVQGDIADQLERADNVEGLPDEVEHAFMEDDDIDQFMVEIETAFLEQEVDIQWAGNTEAYVLTELSYDTLSQYASENRIPEFQARLNSITCRASLCKATIQSSELPELTRFQDLMAVSLGSILPSIRYGMPTRLGNTYQARVFLARNKSSL